AAQAAAGRDVFVDAQFEAAVGLTDVSEEGLRGTGGDVVVGFVRDSFFRTCDLRDADAGHVGPCADDLITGNVERHAQRVEAAGQVGYGCGRDDLDAGFHGCKLQRQ